MGRVAGSRPEEGLSPGGVGSTRSAPAWGGHGCRASVIGVAGVIRAALWGDRMSFLCGAGSLLPLQASSSCSGGAAAGRLLVAWRLSVQTDTCLHCVSLCPPLDSKTAHESPRRWGSEGWHEAHPLRLRGEAWAPSYRGEPATRSAASGDACQLSGATGTTQHPPG